eukprot:6483825-Amphidinium_carterae.1
MELILPVMLLSSCLDRTLETTAFRNRCAKSCTRSGLMETMSLSGVIVKTNPHHETADPN